MSKGRPNAEEILGRFRRAAEPAPSVQGRVLSGLERRLGVAIPVLEQVPPERGRSAPGSGSLPVGRAPQPGAAARPKPSWATSMLKLARWVGFGLLTGGVGYWWGRQDALEARSLQRATQAPAAATSGGAANEEAGRGAALEPVPSAHAPESVPQPRALPSRALPAAARKGHTPPAPLAPRSSKPLGLAEALEHLRRAEAALRAQDAPAAREELAELERKAPGQVLQEERLLARALVACLEGDTALARRLGAELVRGERDSIYRGRLEQSCAGAIGNAAVEKK